MLTTIFRYIASLGICAMILSCASHTAIDPHIKSIESKSDKRVVYFKSEPNILTTDRLDYAARYASMKALCKENSNVNIVDSSGISILAYAAANGDVDFINFLIKSGFSLTDEIPDPYQVCPVYLAKHPVELAIHFNHYDALKVLLENGYPPCCVVDCVEGDKLRMLQLLAEYDAEISDNIPPESIPLIALARSTAMVKYLITKGCNPDKALLYAKNHLYKESEEKIRNLINSSFDNNNQ